MGFGETGFSQTGRHQLRQCKSLTIYSVILTALLTSELVGWTNDITTAYASLAYNVMQQTM